ncbi:MAG: NAD(P)H-binding protein [Sandaracinaceae bacterium]
MSEASDGPAFVAGATGLTGRAVVRHLRARGIETHAHVRPDSRDLDAWRERFEADGAIVDTTAWDEAAMRESLARIAPTIVFALLGTTRKRMAASGGSYETIDYGLSALLRRAAEACGSDPRFVYLSSLGASEGTRNPYLAARVKMERELREGSIPYTIVQPSFITGDRDESRLGESVGAAVANGALAVLGAFGAKTTRDRYRSITGDALGAAMVECALDPAKANAVVRTEDLR